MANDIECGLRSNEGDFLEIGRFVEACRTGEGGLPCQIARGLSSCIVHAEQVDLVLALCLSPPDHVQAHLQERVPSLCRSLAAVLHGPAIVVICSKRRTVSILVGDICEEELRGWAELNFEVVRGVAVEGGDEYLDDVLLVEGIVAFLEGGDDLVVDVGPVHVQEDAVMTERCRSGRVCAPVDKGERNHHGGDTTWDVEGAGCGQQQDPQDKILHLIKMNTIKHCL